MNMMAPLAAQDALLTRTEAAGLVTRPITFLSDYGVADDFVGVCHGVMQRIAPGATIVDLTHGVPRHDVRFHVGFGGRVEADASGVRRWMPADNIEAQAFDSIEE